MGNTIEWYALSADGSLFEPGNDPAGYGLRVLVTDRDSGIAVIAEARWPGPAIHVPARCWHDQWQQGQPLTTAEAETWFASLFAGVPKEPGQTDAERFHQEITRLEEVALG